MKISDFLKLPRTKEKYINRFLNRLRLFNIYDSDLESIDCYNNIIDRYEVYELYKEELDYRRGIWLYVAEFDGEPVAFWYEADREGDDSNSGYILNKVKFFESLDYLRTFIKVNLDYYIETDVNQDFITLDKIYGYDMTKLKGLKCKSKNYI